jgi:hypothetical protein
MTTTERGMGFLGWVTLIFVAGKVFKFIDWSWWVVFSPLFASFALVIILVIVAGILSAIERFNND